VAKQKSRKWLWIGGATAAVVIALVVVAVAKGSGTKIDPSHLGQVTKQDIARSVVATGKVTPITEVQLKSKASGIVTKLFADANDNVKQGQMLAQLDQVEILAQVAAQKASLQSAEATVGTYQANIAQDRVAADAPDLPMYKETYDRQNAMVKDGIVSQQSVDDANRNYQAALNKRDQ
jgi:HlyD family secretion protein